MILSIEREWSKHPGWLASLDKSTQISLIADYRIRYTKPKKKGGNKYDDMRAAISRYQSRDKVGQDGK